MIYPASYDITILQNATWRSSFRVTQNRQELNAITISGGVPKFTLSCHNYNNGDKVVFTVPSVSGSTSLIPSPDSIVPCGLQLNTVYYVISSGLTNDAFYVATASGGSSITASGTVSGVFYSASPVGLSGYTVDSDIKTLTTDEFVATFVPTITDASNGQFDLVMPTSTSSGLATGRYGYDVSLTSAGNERYYWLTGIATVQKTYSRN